MWVKLGRYFHKNYAFLQLHLLSTRLLQSFLVFRVSTTVEFKSGLGQFLRCTVSLKNFNREINQNIHLNFKNVQIETQRSENYTCSLYTLLTSVDTPFWLFSSKIILKTLDQISLDHDASSFLKRSNSTDLNIKNIPTKTEYFYCNAKSVK
jgi:hypothetical protein